MKISLNELRLLTEKALSKQGHEASEVKTIADVLLYAQLRGNNQGIVKLIGKGIPKNTNASLPKLIKETAASALYDGSGTHAIVVMSLITEVAVKKAKESGIGLVGNFNTAESTGALGYYAKKVADAGLVGAVFSSAPFQTTAPHGSTEALFCTNPMAFGIPSESEPIVLDMSTSAIAYYGLIEAKTAGRLVAEGLGYNKEGRPTQDPAEIMSGAIRVFGGHKGSGLALVVQILAGALVGADSFNSDSDNAGNLVLAINPSLLTKEDDFKKEVSKIISRIKSARKAEGVTEIYYPGERANNFYKNIIAANEIEVEDNLLSALKSAAQ